MPPTHGSSVSMTQQAPVGGAGVGGGRVEGGNVVVGRKVGEEEVGGGEGRRSIASHRATVL